MTELRVEKELAHGLLMSEKTTQKFGRHMLAHAPGTYKRTPALHACA
jgi:hypothetical protein